MEAALLIGIQASGKTTFYQRHLSDTHVRISLDVVRTRHRECLLLEACLEGGQRFVVDNTNPTAAERARYVAPAREAGFRVTGYFFEPDPDRALEWNEGRDRRVPVAGLLGTLKRLERPQEGEGFDALYRVVLGADGRFQVSPYGP